MGGIVWRLLVLAVAGAVGFATGWRVHGWKTASDAADAAQTQREDEQMARKANDARTQEVDRATQRRQRQAAAADAALRDELQRLRAAIAARDADPNPAACAGIAARAAQARGLLGTCSERYQDVARDAQRYADQLRGWQALMPDRAPEEP
ncbi:MAG: hypothetical protein HS128_19095 [Ideonella sp.]|nr:hypothetical protein [Ideonella sp.]MCC7456003.1 hypothetical protein [Nitrospira sp.]